MRQHLAATAPWSRRQILSLAGAWLGSAAFSASAKTGTDVLLAKNAPARFNPVDYLVSEKLDGVRAVWDGKTLRFRSGREIAAPAWFLAKLPQTPMDGELWLGRGRFDALSGMVRKTRTEDADWQQIRYMIFELPDSDGDFALRYHRMRLMTWGTGWDQLQHAQQVRFPTMDGIRSELKRVVGLGGEGLMLHLATSPYVTGRSDTLLKLKPLADAEAKVVAHISGKGKYEGLLGALQVQTEDGQSFRLGTGFSDEQRKAPPPVGSLVTYSYRDLTPSGKPRFASFLRLANPE
ncbi:MAG: DNA ligase [Rhodoferax sp.]